MVRITCRPTRHPHVRGFSANRKATANRPAKKLELLRKRAKRAFIQVYGHEPFSEKSRRWQEFIRVVRAELLPVLSGQRLLKGPDRRPRRRQIVELRMERLRGQLPAEGFSVPAEDPFRELVSRGLRSADRLIRQLGLRTIHQHPGMLGERICSYVRRRCSVADAAKVPKVVGSRSASIGVPDPMMESMPASRKSLIMESEAAELRRPYSSESVRCEDAGTGCELRLDGVGEPSIEPPRPTTSPEASPIVMADVLRGPDHGEDAELSQFQKDWPSPSASDHGPRLMILTEAGHSRRALARVVGCSEGLIRQLLKLTNLADEERESLREGNFSCRHALKEVEARKALEYQDRLTSNQKTRTEHINSMAAVAMDWILSLGLSRSYQQQLIEELRWGPYRARWWKFAQVASQPRKPVFDKDPKEIIRRTRPKGEPPIYGSDLTNYYVIWYACWSRHLMPTVGSRDAVMERVSQKFRGIELTGLAHDLEA